MQGPENVIELFHGYTLFGTPGLLRGRPGHFGRLRQGRTAEPRRLAGARVGRTPCIRCAGLPHVLDVRNYGLIGAVELESRAGKPGARAFEVFLKCFERGVMGAADRRHSSPHRRH